MTNPEDDNYSDDEQAFLTYYLFYFTGFFVHWFLNALFIVMLSGREKYT